MDTPANNQAPGPADWFDREEFWRDLYPFLFPRERLDQAAAESERILELHGARAEAALDLCCGPGRHAVPLAKKGIRVTAVDRTALYLEKARELAALEGVEVEWILEDMRRFVRPRAFDLVLNMYTSFGYFAREEDNLLVLANIHRSLREGGTLVMDLVGKEWLAENYVNTNSTANPDGSILVQRHRVLEGWTRVKNDWILIRDGKARTHSFTHTIYSGAEIRGHLLSAGFQSVRLLGGLDGGEYGPGADRLVAVARK